MGKNVLITGGAGFVGSHLADELLRQGHAVRTLDNLHPQVHGPAQERPGYLDSRVELIVGDVRDRDAVKRALDGIDVVYHLAAMVGVGQSMYQIDQYVEANTFGTAVLLQCLVDRPVDRLVVASSMSIYGEGLYRTPDGELVSGVERDLEHLSRQRWEPEDAAGQPLTPVATQGPGPTLGLRPHQVRPGASLPHGRARVPDSHRRPPLLQHLRNTPGALESVYGSARDLRLESAERQTAADS